MDFLKRMTSVINYIEEHITEGFDYNDLAKIVCCDFYQFGRIFSYVIGLPFNEYIRNRRLSLAALELQKSRAKVIDVALKYGYNSPESFARAFREMHGVSPKEAYIKGVTLRLYPRVDFQIFIKGVTGLEYRIEEKNAIKCVGISYHLAKGEDGWKNGWEKYLDIRDESLGGTPDAIITCKHHLYRAPFWQIGVAQTYESGETVLSIGAEDAGGDYPGFDSFDVPAATWAIFIGNKDLPLGMLFSRINTEWLPESGYEKSMNYTVEIYPPGNTQSDEYRFEVWIPVKKK